MKTMKIFHLDNDISAVKPIQDFFQLLDAEVYFTTNSKDVLDRLESEKPNLIFVSLKQAHEHDWRLLKQFRRHLMPIIGLVEHDQSHLMKEGEVYGIDAYLVKPLDFFHLKTYFPSVLSQIRLSRNHVNSENERRTCYDRRASENGRRWYDRLYQIKNIEHEGDTVVNVGPFMIDKSKKCVFRNGDNLKLTPTEYKLFLLLLENKEQVVSTKDIISNIWSLSRRASEEDVKQYVYMLRKKIEDNPSHPQMIHTQKGFGYMLSCVSPLPASLESNQEYF